jgi:catechol 2,3-dioxygenase
VVLRISDLQRSILLYCETLSFKLIRVLHNSIAFVSVAAGVEGHTQIIGLFSNEWQASRDGQRWDGWSPLRTTLHHVAIEISLRDYESVLRYLEVCELRPNTMVHDWIGWRSTYISDLDNNTLEVVTDDETVLKSDSR